jgi:hypothetical protein
MFAEIDRMDIRMSVKLATFAPAFLCLQVLEFIYLQELPSDVFWKVLTISAMPIPKAVLSMLPSSRASSLDLQGEHVVPAILLGNLCPISSLGCENPWTKTKKFLQKKPEEWSDIQKRDHPYAVQQEKLQRPMPHLVKALIHQMDPLGQYKNINILIGPELLQSTKQKMAQKKAQKKACQLALTYSSVWFRQNNKASNKPKPYIS